VQTVTGKAVAETQRQNFLNALQGRVAGLTVTPTTGTAGASSQIVLRGFNSASLSNQPLFIVDGVIIDNSTFNETSNGGTGIGLASDKPNRNNDYTNRIADLNPNDIESYTILKGPEATALYGSQASSGAIVITTRKAKANGKPSVSYDNSFRVTKLNRFAQLNNDFSPGTSGIPAGAASTSFTYYGPAYGAGTKMYDNIGNFFRTGFAQTHNIGVDFGVKNAGFRFSGLYYDENGVIPKNELRKISFRLSNNTKIGKYIDINPSISYTNSVNDKPIRGAGGFLLDLYAWPTTDNASVYLDKTGHKRLLYAAAPNTEVIDNPFFNVNKNHSQDKTDRVVATMGIDIHPYSWLSIAGRFGYDTYKQNGYSFYHPETSSNSFTAALGGGLDNYFMTYWGYNHTINATAKKTWRKWSGRLMVGTMWQDYETKIFSVYGTNLIDSTSTDSSNTKVSTRTRLLRNAYGQPNLSILRQQAYFGEASLSYDNVIFLSYTHRFESASVFAANNRNYNYPGVSLSAIISDIIPGLKKGGILDYAKLRASLASTARIPDPYLNQSVFVNNQASSSVPAYSYGFYNNNPDLVPEQQKTYEVGAEFRFLNNRISLEGAYYNTHNLQQISIGFRASYATGYVLNTQNATESRNQGVEIALGVTPVKTADWNWDVKFNFSHMWSNVISIPASIAPALDYYISDTWLYANTRGGYVRNHPTTTITGYAYSRNSNGDILINPATGLPVVNSTFLPIGDRNPDFVLGTSSSLRYKNWTMNMLWDLKVGGDIFNGTDMYLTTIGKSKRTADRMTPRIVKGVLNDGLQNTANPTVNTIMVTPYYINNYYGETTGMPDEEFVQHNVNWLRLRDISVSYSLPPSFFKGVRALKSLSIFAAGSDLILFTNYNGADPAVNGVTAGTRGVGAYAFDYGNVATPKAFNFGLRANF
jgi:TonB-linked SusC/RagA family outer membrane protein